MALFSFGFRVSSASIGQMSHGCAALSSLVFPQIGGDLVTKQHYETSCSWEIKKFNVCGEKFIFITLLKTHHRSFYT